MNSILKAEINDTITAINCAWRENHPLDMQSFLHSDIIMVCPGFSSSVQGREAILAGFVAFCSNARVL